PEALRKRRRDDGKMVTDDEIEVARQGIKHVLGLTKWSKRAEAVIHCMRDNNDFNVEHYAFHWTTDVMYCSRKKRKEQYCKAIGSKLVSPAASRRAAYLFFLYLVYEYDSRSRARRIEQSLLR
ncbi:MAG: hypothetical protein ACP5NO_08485, partial [Thermoplasmata archaeon]